MRFQSIAALFLVLMGSSATLAQDAPSDKEVKLTVNVTEILVHATVTTHHGTPVDGLTREAFQISENGAPQTIKHFGHQDIPVTAGIVIDNSGSMKPKREEVIAAALAFADSSNPLDQMFLVNFNEHVTFGLPAKLSFTDRPEQLRAAMASVKADGKTALFDAVAVALEHLKKGTRDKRILIVVSDGADNASTHTKAQILELATRSDAIIYALGIYDPNDQENKDPHFMSELAKASGGEAYFPETLKEVRPDCERIAHAIRNQYSISYIPTNRKQDGSFRRIKIRASSPQGGNLKVTTRDGYVAPLSGTPAARD